MGVRGVGKAGPRLGAEGSYGQFRSGDLSQTLRDRARPSYAEMATRGQVWSVQNPRTGVPIRNSGGSFNINGIAPLVLVNPFGSGVNLELLRGWLGDADPANSFAPTGAWAYGVASLSAVNMAALAVPNLTPRNHTTGMPGSKVMAYSDQSIAPVGNGTYVATRFFPAGGTGSSLGGQHVFLNVDEIAGDLVIPPGTAITYIAPNAGSSFQAQLAFTWAEVPGGR